MGHLSVLEHATFNVLVEDAPVVNEIFAIRFRLGSFTVKSRRYTDVLKDGFYEDPRQPISASFLNQIQSLYAKMKERKIPLEDIRFIFPYAFKTNFIFSMNGRELGYFLYCALYENTLHPIREMGKRIVDQLREVFPLYETNLEIFAKEKRKSPVPAPSSTFIPREPVAILSSTPHGDQLYQNLLLFAQEGNFYQADPEIGFLEQSLNFPHNRALEAVVLTFYLRDITLAGLTHILRHRMHSPLYPDLFNPGLKMQIITPPTIKNSPFYEEYLELASQSAKLENETGNIYYRLVGFSFPMITTINARELIHFFKLRLCQRAQWEIRDLAEKMLKVLQQKEFLLFKKSGPSCVYNGSCPEGSHTCGKIQEMLRKFGISENF
jgi:thymidylate synthase (FAD)